MGHYSDYYAAEAEEKNKLKFTYYKRALEDLQDFRQYNHIGKLKPWTFNDIGLEKEFDAMLDKLKARLYELKEYEE